jgi:hypothetical protein
MRFFELLPSGLYSEDPNSNIQKIFRAIDATIEDCKNMKDRIRLNLSIRNMEIDWGVEDWEDILSLPHIGKREERIGKIRAKLVGGDETEASIISVFHGFFPYIEKENIQIVKVKDTTPSYTHEDNFKFYIFALDPEAGSTTVDTQVVVDIIEKYATHHEHCTGAFVLKDFWEWGDITKPLDDPLYGTWSEPVETTLEFVNEIKATTGEYGNTERINGFINSFSGDPFYTINNLSLRITGTNNILVGGKYFPSLDIIHSVILPISGNENQLIYLENNAGNLDINFTTTHTAGDPDTYPVGIYPICELELNTSSIVSITDVRHIT